MCEIHYLEEIIINENNIPCKVIDLTGLDFSHAKLGIKKTITLVKCAKGNEVIINKNKDGNIESSDIAKCGEAIFYNNKNDKYIPKNSLGEPYLYHNIENYGYTIIKKRKNYCFVKSNNQAKLLVNIIQEPSCIKDAWGEGSHQFLFKGATLKQDLKTLKITGIDGIAFSNTWEILK